MTVGLFIGYSDLVLVLHGNDDLRFMTGYQIHRSTHSLHEFTLKHITDQYTIP
jgi:hypothetical protein